ncbi:Pb2 [Thalictrum thalictroides]|uniref:Pb2 n=1 Tax=Thalictrum thalictroides TaxID=46969 RepID=A0A7J6X2V0_THATH|nr:Pb2 [Thalictrum thalictroides]
MSTVKQVLEFSKLAAELCRETPVANLRAVRRSAKNTKDPSPLSSTIITINTKYPISVDRVKARRYGIPAEFLAPSNDAHQFGRQLCKIEAVDWWVDNAAEPNDDLQNLVRLLYSQHTKDATDYYGIDWRETHIVLCQSHLKGVLFPPKLH